MGQVSDALVFGSFVFMMMFLILIGVLVRIYIGRSAIRQAKGKKKSSFYLVLTAVLILLGVMSIISSVQKWVSGYETQLAVEDISLASILIEVTSVVMFVELFVNAISDPRIKVDFCRYPTELVKKIAGELLEKV